MFATLRRLRRDTLGLNRRNLEFLVPYNPPELFAVVDYKPGTKRRLAAAGIPVPANFAGQWRNQYASTMMLSVSGNTISGDYTSAVSGGGGPITGSLRGFVAGDLISFTVLWPNGSMTAWVGQIINDATDPRIKTLWHLVMDTSDANEPTDLWGTVLAGADEFMR